jgi:hypothetical protein
MGAILNHCRIQFVREYNKRTPHLLGLSAMSKQISFRDANGRRVSGCFEVSHRIITVIASDGRMKTANVDEAVLGPETLAKMLLLQLHQERRSGGLKPAK